MDNNQNSQGQDNTGSPTVILSSQIKPGVVDPRNLVVPVNPKNGDLFYSNGTTFVKLSPGTAGQVLTLTGGVPTWVTPAAIPIAIAFATTGQQNPAFNTSSQSLVDVPNATLTINPTKTVTVHAVASGIYYGTHDDNIKLALLIDGSVIYFNATNNSATTNSPMTFSLNAQASVASGARIIKLQVANQTAARAVVIDYINLSVIWG